MSYNHEDDSFIIDTMTWSFSRLNSFDNCPYEWRLNYIDNEKQKDNFFAQFGSLCHGILEDYAKNKLSLFEVSDAYEDRFPKMVTEPAPWNKNGDMLDTYYEKGLDYFNNIDLDIDNYEILGVEKKVEFEIDGIPMIGYIDLLLKNKETGEITILDHKSGSLKFKKNGSLSNAKDNKAHELEFKRQLYLYSVAVIEEYGHVDYLEWNLFKDRKHYKIPWNKKEFDEAKDWAIKTIEKIKAERVWGVNKDYYYCNHLCSQRTNCPHRK